MAGLPTAAVVQDHGKAVEKGQNPMINSLGLALMIVMGKVKGKRKNPTRKIRTRKMMTRKMRPRKTLS